jgi:hypothetical protein
MKSQTGLPCGSLSRHVRLSSQRLSKILRLVDHQGVVPDAERSGGLDEFVRELQVPELVAELVPVGRRQVEPGPAGQLDGEAVHVLDVEPVSAVPRPQVVAQPPVEADEQHPEALRGRAGVRE